MEELPLGDYKLYIIMPVACFCSAVDIKFYFWIECQLSVKLAV